MSLSLQQLPAQCDIYLVAGDRLSFAVNFGRDISGYAILVGVYKQALSVPTTGGQAKLTKGDDVFTPVVQITDSINGVATVVFTESQTALLNATDTYHWYVHWVPTSGDRRTLVSGSAYVTVR